MTATRTNYGNPKKIRRGQSPGTRKGAPPLTMGYDGRDLYVEMDGIRIAKRGHPNTPQDRTWVALEPGYSVFDSPGKNELIVEYHEPRAQ